MKVWVVEMGEYEDKHIVGVYADVQSALVAHPIPPEAEPGFGQTLGWEKDDGDYYYGDWANGGFGQHFGTITEYEVKT